MKTGTRCLAQTGCCVHGNYGKQQNENGHLMLGSDRILCVYKLWKTTKWNRNSVLKSDRMLCIWKLWEITKWNRHLMLGSDKMLCIYKQWETTKWKQALDAWVRQDIVCMETVRNNKMKTGTWCLAQTGCCVHGNREKQNGNNMFFDAWVRQGDISCMKTMRQQNEKRHMMLR